MIDIFAVCVLLFDPLFHTYMVRGDDTRFTLLFMFELSVVTSM